MMGQCALSTGSKMMQNWEEWLIHQVVAAIQMNLDKMTNEPRTTSGR